MWVWVIGFNYSDEASGSEVWVLAGEMPGERLIGWAETEVLGWSIGSLRSSTLGQLICHSLTIFKMCARDVIAIVSLLQG